MNSVLSSLPVYLMSFFALPCWVIKAIDRIRHSFFWKDQRCVSGIACLISWDKVCLPKHVGGLGVLDLKAMNVACLGKWWWNFLSRPSLLWVRLIKHMYYSWSFSWVHPDVSPSYFWRGILRFNEPFFCSTSVVVGSGFDSSFWHDVWLPVGTLKAQFPHLFSISLLPHICVAEGIHLFRAGRWDLLFNRTLIASTADAVQTIYQMLPVSLSDQLDSRVWTRQTSGSFTVHSYYSWLVDPGMRFSALRLWKVKVPLKVKILMWLLVKGRLLTRDVLLARGLVLTASNCPCCDLEFETCQHLFLLCSYVQPVWSHLRRLGFCTPTDFNAFWSSVRQPKRIQQLCDLTVMAVVSCLWRERNARIFMASSKSSETLLHEILSLIHFWSATAFPDVCIAPTLFAGLGGQAVQGSEALDVAGPTAGVRPADEAGEIQGLVVAPVDDLSDEELDAFWDSL